MNSGGLTTASAPASSSSTDPAALERQQSRVAALAAQYADAAEAAQQCRADQATAAGDARYAEQAARQAAEAARSAEEQVSAYAHQNESALAALNPDRANIDATRNLGIWQDIDFRRRRWGQLLQAILEKKSEDENRFGDILLACNRSRIRMGAAICGLTSSLTGELSLATYCRIPEPLSSAAPETFARIASMISALDGKEDEIRRRGADPYPGQQAAEASAKNRQAEEAHREAVAAAERAKRETDVAIARRNSLRAEHAEAANEIRRIDGRRREIASQIS